MLFSKKLFNQKFSDRRREPLPCEIRIAYPEGPRPRFRPIGDVPSLRLFGARGLNSKRRAIVGAAACGAMKNEG